MPAYLAAAGNTGTVAVNGKQVTVTVTISQPTQILSLAGIDHLTETGTGTATAEQAPTHDPLFGSSRASPP